MVSNSTRVFFDLPMKLNQAASYLNNVLPRGGYAPLPTQGSVAQRSAGGFQPAQSPTDAAQWYRKDKNELLTYSLEQVGNVTQVTVLRDQLSPNDFETRLMFARQSDPMAQLPKLSAPTESRVLLGGGGSSNSDIYQNATIETALPLLGLYNHYARQLESSGWKLLQKGGMDSVQVSIWQTPQKAIGQLNLIATGRGSYKAMLSLTQTR